MAQFICASQGAVTFTVALLFKSIESVARVRKSSPMLILLKLVMRIRCVDHLKTALFECEFFVSSGPNIAALLTIEKEHLPSSSFHEQRVHQEPPNTKVRQLSIIFWTLQVIDWSLTIYCFNSAYDHILTQYISMKREARQLALQQGDLESWDAHTLTPFALRAACLQLSLIKL